MIDWIDLLLFAVGGYMICWAQHELKYNHGRSDLQCANTGPAAYPRICTCDPRQSQNETNVFAMFQNDQSERSKTTMNATLQNKRKCSAANVKKG